jgi:hypothetical protein
MVVWKGATVTTCRTREDMGDIVIDELIHARSSLASTIWCRQDDVILTSDEEAI